VALTEREVHEFLAAPKHVPQATALRWRQRNAQVRMARVGLVISGVQRGELLLLYHLDHARHWTFKITRRGIEVLRWDAQPPPHSHSNPVGRPPDWPRKFRDDDHEHAWHHDYAMKLARPSAALAAAVDHHAAFVAFCARANIDPADCYRSPPPPTEQLTIPTT
jgi:hypothetical protein